MNEKKMTGAQWLKIIIFMMISYIFFNYLIIKIVWDNLKIIIMILSSFIILGCFIPGNIKNKSKGIFYSSMSFMLITPIIFSLLYSYSSNTLIKKQYQPLVHFLNQYAANEKVYFLSTHLHLGYPIITYSKAESASRFPSFWMLAGLVRHSLNDSDPISRQHEIEDKNKIIEMVSEDLKKHKPKYIFIDTSEKKGRFAFFKKEKNEFTLNSIPFEYLPLFLTNKHFSEAWVSYRYFTRIKEPQQESIYQAAFPYQVDVYERI